jgi:hypothetical protein
VKVLVFGILLFAATNGFAQTISNSPYSVYGVGLLKERTSAHNRALAQTGIGLRDPLNLNTLNPAAYTSIQTITQISELGLFYEKDKLITQELAEKSSTGSLTSVNLWFRFHKNWGGIVGLAPFSTINYTINSTKDFGEQIDAPVQYTGQGGLTQAYFGNGFQLTKNFSLGFNAAYIFGSIEREETVASTSISGLRLEDNTYINKPSIDFGAQYAFFLRENKELTFGATYATHVNLNTSSTKSIFQYLATSEDSLYTEEVEVDDYILPSQIGFGVAYQLPRSTFAADLKLKNWSNAQLDKGLTLQNTARFSFAYEYKGNPKSEKYLNAVALRSGFYTQNNYFVLKNTPFREWGFLLGAGLPISGNRGTLNLSYNYNHTGTTEKKLIEQNAQVFMLDIVFRDLWGIKRKFD